MVQGGIHAVRRSVGGKEKRTHSPLSDLKALPEQLLLQARWRQYAYMERHLQKVIPNRAGSGAEEGMGRAGALAQGYKT